MPGPAEVVFLIVLGMLLIAGPYVLLNDPGTPWHLRLGREILATRDVPRFDTLTFTRQHASWIDQSWGFDVMLAMVVDSWGWSAAIGLTALGLAALYAAVARDLIRDGTSPVVAVVVALLVSAVSSVHFLLRPHLFTFAFAYLTLPRLPETTQTGRLVCRLGTDLHGRAGQPAWRLCRAAGDRGDGRAGPRDFGSMGRRATAQPPQVRSRRRWRAGSPRWSIRMDSGSIAMSLTC